MDPRLNKDTSTCSPTSSSSPSPSNNNHSQHAVDTGHGQQKRVVNKIVLNLKQLQKTGLDRQLALALSKQKILTLNANKSAVKKNDQKSITPTNSVVPVAMEKLTKANKIVGAAAVVDNATQPRSYHMNISSPKKIIPPKITITQAVDTPISMTATSQSNSIDSEQLSSKERLEHVKKVLQRSILQKQAADQINLPKANIRCSTKPPTDHTTTKATTTTKSKNTLQTPKITMNNVVKATSLAVKKSTNIEFKEPLPINLPGGASLIVLENKVLSQSEKIDLSALRLGTIKRENEEPTTININVCTREATESTVPPLNSNIAAIVNNKAIDSSQKEPKVNEVRKVVLSAEKLKKTPEQIAALAKQIQSKLQVNSKTAIGKVQKHLLNINLLRKKSNLSETKTSLEPVQLNLLKFKDLKTAEKINSQQTQSHEGTEVVLPNLSQNIVSDNANEKRQFAVVNNSSIDDKQAITIKLPEKSNDHIIATNNNDSIEENFDDYEFMSISPPTSPETTIELPESTEIKKPIEILKSGVEDSTQDSMKQNIQLNIEEKTNILIDNQKTRTNEKNDLIEKTEESFEHYEFLSISPSTSSEISINRPKSSQLKEKIQKSPSNTENINYLANNSLHKRIDELKSVREYTEKASPKKNILSAVDYIAQLTALHPITESTQMELSAEELNLNATFSMGFSPLHLPDTKRDFNKLSWKKSLFEHNTDDEFSSNNDLSIGKILPLNNVDILDATVDEADNSILCIRSPKETKAVQSECTTNNLEKVLISEVEIKSSTNATDKPEEETFTKTSPKKSSEAATPKPLLRSKKGKINLVQRSKKFVKNFIDKDLKNNLLVEENFKSVDNETQSSTQGKKTESEFGDDINTTHSSIRVTQNSKILTHISSSNQEEHVQCTGNDLSQLFHPPKILKNKRKDTITEEEITIDSEIAESMQVSLIDSINYEEPEHGPPQIPFKKQSEVEEKLLMTETLGIKNLLQHLHDINIKQSSHSNPENITDPTSAGTSCVEDSMSSVKAITLEASIPEMHTLPESTSQVEITTRKSVNLEDVGRPVSSSPLNITSDDAASTASITKCEPICSEKTTAAAEVSSAKMSTVNLAVSNNIEGQNKCIAPHRKKFKARPVLPVKRSSKNDTSKILPTSKDVENEIKDTSNTKNELNAPLEQVSITSNHEVNCSAGRQQNNPEVVINEPPNNMQTIPEEQSIILKKRIRLDTEAESELDIEMSVIHANDTYDDETAKDESSQDERTLLGSRKRQRKTIEEYSRKNKDIPPTSDSDEDLCYGFDDANAESPTSSNSMVFVLSEDARKTEANVVTSSNSKTFQNWLTTGKAISPTSSISVDPISMRGGMPLKKRWELTKGIKIDTDITDDASPIEDDTAEPTSLNELNIEHDAKNAINVLDKEKDVKLATENADCHTNTILIDEKSEPESCMEKTSDANVEENPISRNQKINCENPISIEISCIPSTECVEIDNKLRSNKKKRAQRMSSTDSESEPLAKKCLSSKENESICNLESIELDFSVDNEKEKVVDDNPHLQTIEKSSTKKPGRPKKVKKKIVKTKNEETLNSTVIEMNCTKPESVESNETMANITLESEAVLNDTLENLAHDDICSVPKTNKTTKKRGRPPANKKLTPKLAANQIESNLSTTKELGPEHSTPVQTKKRGRPPANKHKLDDDSHTQTATPVESGRKTGQKNIEDESTHTFNPRLLLIRRREQLDTDELLTATTKVIKGSFQCGLCFEQPKKSAWIEHLATHYGIGWVVGEPPLIVTSRSVVLATMTSFFRTTGIKGVSCRLCDRLYRSALGLLQHAEQCGAVKQRIQCEYCKQQYSKLSYQGHVRSCVARQNTTLDDELTTTVDLDTNKNESEEIFSKTGRAKRASTIKAETKLKQLGKELLLQGDKELPEIKPKEHVVYQASCDLKAIRAKWIEEIKNFGKAFCFQKSCKFNAPTAEAMEQHIRQCSFILKPGFHCKICKLGKSVFDSEEKALNHITVEHKTHADFEAEDSEYGGNENQSSDEDDGSSGVNSNEDEIATEQSDLEVSGTSTGKNRKKNISLVGTSNKVYKPLFAPRLKEVQNYAERRWRKFTDDNFSTKMLFDYAKPMYNILDLSTVEKYLPQQYTSLNFCFNESAHLPKDFGSSTDERQWSQLKRFTCAYQNDEQFFYMGAAVRHVAWVPLPSNVQEQFLVCVYRKSLNYTRHMNPKISPDIIVVLKITSAENEKDGQLITHLHYGIYIPEGPVLSIRLLPSGGYDSDANRLGLLAVGCVNQSVKIYALPLALNDNFKCVNDAGLSIIELDASLVLDFDLQMQNSSNLFSALRCTQICWSEYSGHNILVAGFANGCVGIWDIEESESNNLNCFKIENVRHIVPLHFFYFGEKNIQNLALHYDTNGVRWLAVSSVTRRYAIYDIRNMSQPELIYNDISKYFIPSFEWSSIWETITIGCSDTLCSASSRIMSMNPTGIRFSHCTIDPTLKSVRSIHYSPLLNIQAVACDNGDVIFINAGEQRFELGNKKTAQSVRAIYTLDVQKLSVDQNKAEENSFIKKTETDLFKDYGIVFHPLVKLLSSNPNSYLDSKREPPLNILPHLRVNCIRCNLNHTASRWVAVACENGFLRIFKFNRHLYFGKS